MQNLFLALVLTFVFYGVFFLTAVFVFLADPTKWVGLLAAVVHPFMAIPIAFFVFYKGYFGAQMGKGYWTFYKFGETMIIAIGAMTRVLRVLLLAVLVPRSPLPGVLRDQPQVRLHRSHAGHG